MADNETVELESTSKSTSTVSPPIVVRKNGIGYTHFDPVIVNNTKNPESHVKGKLIVERKGKSDEWTIERLQRSTLKIGQHTEIDFSPSDTYELYCGLRKLYEGFSSEDGGEYAKYHQFNGTPESIVEFVKSRIVFDYPPKPQDPNRDELYLLLAQLMCEKDIDSKKISLLLNELKCKSSDFVDFAIKALSMPDDMKIIVSKMDDVAISKLQEAVNLSQLKIVRAKISSNLDCNDEKKWQKFFETHDWILSQLFPTPLRYYGRELNTGGKDIFGKGSNTFDFAYKNTINDNITLIEIKTPCTELVGDQYRNNVYCLGKDVVGAVSQVLQNKSSLYKNYNQIIMDTEKGKSEAERKELNFEIFNPRCVVLIGNLSTIANNPDMCATFDNYRNSLSNITIITYDELLARVDMILELMSTSRDVNSTMD